MAIMWASVYAILYMFKCEDLFFLLPAFFFVKSLKVASTRLPYQNSSCIQKEFDSPLVGSSDWARSLHHQVFFFLSFA